MERDAADRRKQLISLWLQRPPGKRTEHDLFIFYGELVRTRQDLLHGPGDPYQELKVDLGNHMEG